MIIKNIDAYLDGGTYKIESDIGTYYIDHRIDTDTPNAIYDKYPDEEKARIVSSPTFKEALRFALEDYKGKNPIYNDECINEIIQSL